MNSLEAFGVLAFAPGRPPWNLGVFRRGRMLARRLKDEEEL
jgi:hypothetical protein